MRPWFDPGTVEDLAYRLRHVRMPTTATSSWDLGVPTKWLARLLQDWQAFDPTRLVERLDTFEHVVVDVDGVVLHVMLAHSPQPGAAPLVLTHGWPSSPLEYLDLAPLLADPVAHGGSAADAFEVVIPSLPGVGFSGAPPAEGLTYRQVAARWHELMTEVLGHQQYFAHGSDLGAGVTARLARDHPESVIAVHLATPGLPPPPEPWDEATRRHFDQATTWNGEHGGYAHQQATKPATLGVALDDSPAGLAAWIGEKAYSWSSRAHDGGPAFPRDRLLSTLTLYWCTQSATTSLLPYWAYRHNPDAGLDVGEAAPTPTIIDLFGGEIVPFPKPPRVLAERYFHLVGWQEHAVGGHFPAIAEPGLLAARLRDALRPWRN
jgi:pimeloyl-ACP methyl ester carboxylesterase